MDRVHLYSSDSCSTCSSDDDTDAVGVKRSFAASKDSKTSSSPDKDKSNVLPKPCFVKVQPKKIKLTHDGRTRSFNHVDGNWPSYVYIGNFSSSTLPAGLRQLAADAIDCASLRIQSEQKRREKNVSQVGEKRCANSIHSPPKLHVFPLEDVHVSLSRPFVLRLSDHNLFLQQLRLNLKSAKTGSFDCSFCSDENGHDIFCNEEKSRSFVVLKVFENINSKIRRLIRAVDKTLTKFGKSVYYSPCVPHVSVAWFLDDYLGISNNDKKENNVCLWDDANAKDNSMNAFRVNHVFVKIGCKLFKFNLDSL